MIKFPLLFLTLAALHGPGRAAEQPARLPFHLKSGAGGGLKEVIASGAKDIVLHGGTYHLEKPLVLDGKNSGLTLRAAPGEIVILSGGRVLKPDWKPGPDGKFSALVPGDITEIDSLWINGRLQHLARYPNYDPQAKYLNGGSRDALSPERVARWKNPAGGWIHALHSAHWGGVHDRITGVSPDGTVKTEGGWGNNRGTKFHASDRFVENIAEELDAPGEWFFDAATHTLSVIPEAGTDLAAGEVIASRAESLIELRGTREAPVKNVTLQGLTFTRTARTFAKTREPLLRSDWMIHRGGVVFMNRTENCAVQDCDFLGVGGNAVFLSGANLKGRITGCLFKDTGASGVCFVGEQQAVRNAFASFDIPMLKFSQLDLTPGPKTDDYPMECAVTDCLMENLGMTEKQTAAVTIHMSRRITVSHCSMHHLPRAAINIGDGCWGGHVIEGCDAYDTVLESGDHGSFNSWARDRWWGLDLEGHPWDDKLTFLDAMEPVILRNSRWECHHGWDIDLDDGSSNYLIENNLLLSGGLKLREGYHRTVRNNLIPRNGFHFHVWPDNSDDNVIRHNITSGGYTGNVRQPAGWGRHCDENFVHRAGQPVGPAVKMREISGHDAKSLQGDAKFKDADHADWTLAADSPALALGFKPFPLDRFGVAGGRLKPAAEAAYAAFHQSHEVAAARDGTVHEFMGGKVKNLEAYEKAGLGMESVFGVLVVEAPAESALAGAHLVKGDVILSWDKDEIPGIDALFKAAKANPSPVLINAWHDFAKLGLYR
ncbi:MAG: peptide-binding protein [Verrucomicrobiota bacterium]